MAAAKAKFDVTKSKCTSERMVQFWEECGKTSKGNELIQCPGLGEGTAKKLQAAGVFTLAALLGKYMSFDHPEKTIQIVNDDFLTYLKNECNIRVQEGVTVTHCMNELALVVFPAMLQE